MLESTCAEERPEFFTQFLGLRASSIEGPLSQLMLAIAFLAISIGIRNVCASPPHHHHIDVNAVMALLIVIISLSIGQLGMLGTKGAKGDESKTTSGEKLSS